MKLLSKLFHFFVIQWRALLITLLVAGNVWYFGDLFLSRYMLNYSNNIISQTVQSILSQIEKDKEISITMKQPDGSTKTIVLVEKKGK